MSSSSQVIESWISSFCNILGHEYFAEVSEDFIEDDFNLTGLSSQVPMYKEALEMILDVEPEEDEEDDEDLEDELAEDDDDDEDLDGSRSLARRAAAMERRSMRLQPDINAVEASAELLYGLIHQRYITSRPGIGQMHEKYELAHFGSCPRVYCNGCRVLPVGCSDTPGQHTVKLFCPSCLDIYTPPNSRFQTVDGAFFGTTFGCLFLMTFPDLKIAPSLDPDENSAIASEQSQSQTEKSPSQPKPSPATQQRNQQAQAPHQDINGIVASNFAPGLGRSNIYEPRIYGFRVSERARSGPRMRWLRMKPSDLGELDEVRRFEALKQEEEGEEDADGDDEILDDEDDGYAEEGANLPQDTRMQSQEQDAAHVATRRKKAPIRRRKRVSAGDGPGVSGDIKMEEALNVNRVAGVG